MRPVGARAITLLFLSGTLACGAVKRVHECERVIATVNEGLSELYLQVPDAGASPAAYSAIADGYAALGRKLDELAPSDTALAKAVTSYRELTQRAAENSRAYGQALSKPARSRKQRREKEAQLSRLRADAQSDVSRETQAVRKLNGVCHPQ
ncbi:MAG TPA: hypothetical protein VNN80_20040 [Polyangiaceae bacterium]|nr:hypothetical protein [Polyangiaceae bacterium]